MQKRFYYGIGINVPDYMLYQGRKYLFVKDHRGSVNLVVDSMTGEIKQKMLYSEWGEVIEDTNPGFQPFGFAGGLYDVETKLYRFGARDYDPEIGRWLSKDPIGFEGGDTNLYGYVLQDPLNEIDTTGKGPISGGLCVGLGTMYNAASSVPDMMNINKEISARQQNINDIEHRIKNLSNNKCDKTMLERFELNKELSDSQDLLKSSVAKQTELIASIVKKTGGLGGLCAVVFRYPGL